MEMGLVTDISAAVTCVVMCNYMVVALCVTIDTCVAMALRGAIDTYFAVVTILLSPSM